jgi:SAM-dependent methyltransferase
MTQAHQVNQEMREYWTGEGVHDWQQSGDRWETLWAPFGQAMLDAAAIRPGERVLDVGCGAGTTTIAAAEQVAPDGAVVGLDISGPMLAQARQRASGRDTITWLEADAQVYPFEPDSYDVIISRFAVMLFDDPAAGFANLHRALRPGGRLAFVCWQEPAKTEWIAVAVGAAMPLVGRPPDLGGPGAPGPFALADAQRTRNLVAAGGFRDVTMDGITRLQCLGADLDEAVGFVLALPESRELFAAASEDIRAAARTALREAFTPYAGPSGVVTDGSAWLVTAYR